MGYNFTYGKIEDMGMMDKDYNFLSENTIEHISFHDCHCSKMYYQDDMLVLEMEWLEVGSDHPMNPYNQAHSSGVGKVLIQSPTLIKCELYKEPEEKVNLDSLEKVNFCDIRLLGFGETKEFNGFSSQISFTPIGSCCKEFSFALIDVKYKKSFVMWDELKELSWFEK